MALRRTTRLLTWLLAATLVIAGIAFLVLLSVPAPIERWLQDRVLLALQQHYQRDVQLKNLRVTLVPIFRATADDFVLPNRDREGLPPFLTVRHLTAQALPLELLRKPVHLSWVKLDGLVINVPPKHVKVAGEPVAPQRETRLANFVIDRVDADGTELYVLPKQEGREPMNWELRKLTLRSAGIGQPMRFKAELTNPTPPGIIHTAGKFGPWNWDEPSDTAVSGHYDFKNADLSIFNGISGILSSVGDYTGKLNDIVVDGTTDVPDFKLDRGSKAVHLTTQFHALIDGTNGDTYLQPVNAKFLNSRVVAKGEVAGRPGQKGKTISLDVDVHDSRVEDLLNLAVASQRPMLTGAVSTRAKLLIPPGTQTVLARMRLSGNFRVSNAKFTSEAVDEKIAALSRRAQGRPGDESIQDVPASLAGSFSLANAKLSFSTLQFEVPGAAAEVKGSYELGSEALDFTGDVRLQAKVSQTMSGAKRVLLKPVDPIFSRHNAGTYLPVNVSGTRDNPQIKLDVKKIF
jgi:hypothetical protein